MDPWLSPSVFRSEAGCRKPRKKGLIACPIRRGVMDRRSGAGRNGQVNRVSARAGASCQVGDGAAISAGTPGRPDEGRRRRAGTAHHPWERCLRGGGARLTALTRTPGPPPQDVLGAQDLVSKHQRGIAGSRTLNPGAPNGTGGDV